MKGTTMTLVEIADDLEAWLAMARQQRDVMSRHAAGLSDPLGLAGKLTCLTLREVQRRRPREPCTACTFAGLEICPACDEIGKQFATIYNHKDTIMATSIALKIDEDKIQQITAIGNEIAGLRLAKDLTAALQIASGMEQLKKLITPEMMTSVMSLMNSRIGFQTDRDPAKSKKPVTQYSQDVVKECFIESLARGLRPIGNEWNIISGQCYQTVEGYRRVVAETPGLTDLELEAGVPQRVGDTGALVPYYASWKLDGHRHEIVCANKPERDTRIPVRVNAGMGADAILGKARRKMLAKIYERVTGSVCTDIEVDVVGSEDVIDADPKVEEKMTAADQWLTDFEALLAVCKTKTEVDDCWLKLQEGCPNDVVSMARTFLADRKKEIKEGTNG